MGWLDRIFTIGGGEDPEAIRQRQAAAAAAAAKQQQEQTTATNTTNAAAEAERQRQAQETARQQNIFQAQAGISGVFPSGFESTFAPNSLLDEPISSRLGSERSKADQVIARMLSRGTLTDTGGTRGGALLDTQTPGLRKRLSDLGNTLLEQERAGLRGIASRGSQAAGALELGQAFDPESYRGEAQQDVTRFKGGLPGALAAGAPGDLYDTSGVAGAGGAVTGPQNISIDPYAVEGGRLSTGLEEPPPEPSKKRTTAVF